MASKKKKKEIVKVEEEETVVKAEVSVSSNVDEEVQKIIIEKPVVEETVEIKVFPEHKPSDIVSFKVKTGTLAFEQGTYEKGTVLTVSWKRFLEFDRNDVELII